MYQKWTSYLFGLKGCQEIYFYKSKINPFTGEEKFVKIAAHYLIILIFQMSVTQISAKDAFELLKKDKFAVLCDVRTVEEFNFVGTVNADSFGGKMTLIPWLLYPTMQENPNFSNLLEEALQKILEKEFKMTKIIFICKTGGRSNQAASHALNLGYKNCYNIINGFEGDLNQNQQRGKVNGWKADDLPWRQR